MFIKLKHLAIRFSLTRLLLMVAIVAIFCAALAHPTELWTRFIRTMTVIALLAAVVAAFSSQGAARAFWTGAAVCGCALFYLFFVADREFRASLLVDPALHWSYRSMYGGLPSVDSPPSPGFSYSGLARSAWNARAEYFVKQAWFFEISHTALTLLLSTLAGALGSYCYSRSTDNGPRPTDK